MPNASIKSRLARVVVLISASFLILLFGWGWFVWQGVLHDYRNSGIYSILAGIVQYEQTYKTYPPKLSALGGDPATCAKGATASNACLIDDVLASGQKSRYIYKYKASATTASGRVDVFVLTADPVSDERASQRHYFLDQTGVIRVETGRPATAASRSAN
jgi:hypothetical protein